MPENELDLVRLASALNAHEVRYILVGGLAVYLHGGESPTLDMDLAFSTSAANLERLADALEELGARPKRWKTQNYRLREADLATSWLHLESDAGDIDLISKPPGASYETLEAEHVEFKVGDVLLRVASPESLIAMKRAAGRPRDQRHVEELEAILKLQKEVDP